MEVQRFAPTLSTHQHQGPDRLRKKAFIKRAKQVDLVLTSYGLLLRERALLSGRRWGSVVLDEAQAIKNPQTKTARAAFALRAGFRLATTGTPIENRLEELFSLFRFLNPGLLGSERELASAAQSKDEAERAAARRRLRERIRPFLLRRKKRQVLRELPPRTDILLRVEPGKARTLYLRLGGARETPTPYRLRLGP